MNTMTAARLHEIGQPMRLEQLPTPEIGPTDVLVRVKACNVVPNLKNVLATYAEWFPYLPLPKLPAIFGLDCSGEVAGVGNRVQHWKVGDRVYVNPGISCGSCRACRAGEDQNCKNYTFMGYFSFGPDGQRLFDTYQYGGLSEYTVAPQQNLIKLAASISFEQAARFGYLGTAFSALRKANCGPGRTVLVDGASGTLGLGAVLIAVGLGATRVLGTGRNRDLLQEVRRLAPGRIEVLSILDERPLKEWVYACNDGEGADILVSCVGPGAPAEAMVQGISSLRRGGIAVDIGGTMEKVPLDLFWMMCSQISVVGSLWFSNTEAQDMSDMAASGVLDLSAFEQHTFPLGKVNEALAEMPARHGGFTNFICNP